MPDVSSALDIKVAFGTKGVARDIHGIWGYMGDIQGYMAYIVVEPGKDQMPHCPGAGMCCVRARKLIPLRFWVGP